MIWLILGAFASAAMIFIPLGALLDEGKNDRG